MNDNQFPPDWVIREEIEREAYLLWERDGCPDGYDVKYWLFAEQNVYHRYGIEID